MKNCKRGRVNVSFGRNKRLLGLNRKLVAFGIVLVILAFSIYPAMGATTFGRWRDINPAQYTSNVTTAIRSVYIRNGGSGSIGAGDGWLVGGNSTGSLISHYDGFSWQILASPVAGANYTSVHFCLAPGAPGVGSICSPNGDGSDGWMVGGVADTPTPGLDAPVAVYWDGYALTSLNTGLTSGRLNSVFEVCHSPAYGSGGGCGYNSASATTVYAVGSNPGRTSAMMCIFTGTPKASGGWNCPANPTVAHRFTSVYMYVDQLNNLGGFAAGDMGDIATITGSTLVDHVVAPSTVTFHSVFVDQGGSNLEAWAVGSYNSAVGAAIYHFCCGPAGTWGQVSPSATTQDLQSVFLVSQNEGWAVGNQSVILHSTNLGPSGTNQWLALTSTGQTGTGPGIDLLGASFSGGSNGWAVGTKGVILNTQNSQCNSGITSPCWGGNTGITQTGNLTAVFENSQSDTWAGGLWDFVNSANSMIHWDGTKWAKTQVSPPSALAGAPYNIWGIYMSGGGDGWAVGGKTDDTIPMAIHWNGNMWDGQYTSQPVCTCSLRSVYMINSGEGWAVGSGGQFFHYTSSGGTNQWALVAPAWATGIKWNSVFISNPGSNSNAGWAVGNGGSVAELQISSGVANWVSFSIPALAGGTQNLYGVYFTDSSHGWVVGAKGTILTTTDGGNSWSGGAGQVVGGTPATTLRSVSVDMFGTGAGNGDGWAVGGTTEDQFAYTVMAHWDGLSWTSTTISPPPEPVPGSPPTCPTGLCGLALNSVQVKGTQDGWAVGAGTFPTWPAGPAPLAGIFHLDPLEPPVSGGGSGGATTVVTTFTPATGGGATTVATTITATSAATTATGKSVSTVTNVLTTGTTVTGTSSMVSTASMVITSIAVSTALIYNTLEVPGIPGFPWESIMAGILIGLACIGILRRIKKR
jgi:photosystem II stability/assembly factor-like uncharacterized protein